MADTYSKLLGLSDTPPPSSDSGKAKPARIPIQQEKKTDLLANQQTSKEVPKQASQLGHNKAGKETSISSPSQGPVKKLDTSLLTTKEKTKYGTYLTDESIQKISIRAIQTNRDAHQIVQEAINQYFKKLEN